MPPTEHKIEIAGPEGVLEAQITEFDTPQPLGVVVCHPHPLYGGTMAHPVVRAVYKAFVGAGFPALRFNFRGVGRSKGDHANGEGEREDVLAVCKHFLHGPGRPDKILIVGYSFGAAVGGSIINELSEIHGFVAISYPFVMIPQFIPSSQSTKPKFFLTGDADDFTPISMFHKAVAGFPAPTDIRVFEGVDHFWVGAEDALATEILSWVKTHFP